MWSVRACVRVYVYFGVAKECYVQQTRMKNEIVFPSFDVALQRNESRILQNDLNCILSLQSVFMNYRFPIIKPEFETNRKCRIRIACKRLLDRVEASTSRHFNYFICRNYTCFSSFPFPVDLGRFLFDHFIASNLWFIAHSQLTSRNCFERTMQMHFIET